MAQVVFRNGFVTLTCHGEGDRDNSLLLAGHMPLHQVIGFICPLE